MSLYKMWKKISVFVVLIAVTQCQCKSAACSEDEENNPCINAQCGPVYCSQRDLSPYCPSIGEPCRAGCSCVQGYLIEDGTGKCVEKSQCKSEKVKVCNPKTQDWSTCANAQCKPEFCSEKNNPEVCPSISEACRGGCVCLPGYLKDDSTGDCKPKSEC